MGTFLLIAIVILAPPAYFAWRAGQPMELPEFGGKTFYQVEAERQQEYAVHETHWQLTHHGEYPMHSKCGLDDPGIPLVLMTKWANFAIELQSKAASGRFKLTNRE